jgi:hypothetical protein
VQDVGVLPFMILVAVFVVLVVSGAWMVRKKRPPTEAPDLRRADDAESGEPFDPSAIDDAAYRAYDRTRFPGT